MYLADRLSIAQNIAHRAVVTIASVFHRLFVTCREDMLFLDDLTPGLGQFVDPVELHLPRPQTRCPTWTNWPRSAMRCAVWLSFLGGCAFRQRPIEARVHALIIEDDYLIAQSLRDMLETFGFTKFSFARSEDAAVMGANQPDIDLITADVRLLPGDGVSAVEAICTDRDLPVLFITGYRDELEERKSEAVVIQKPVKEQELREAIGKLLGDRFKAG
ncbi:MAG: response regulator [Sphingomicrobium sp.]